MNLFKTILLEKKLTIKQLSETIGVSEAFIYDRLNDNSLSNISLDIFLDILKLCNNKTIIIKILDELLKKTDWSINEDSVFLEKKLDYYALQYQTIKDYDKFYSIAAFDEIKDTILKIIELRLNPLPLYIVTNQTPIEEILEFLKNTFQINDIDTDNAVSIFNKFAVLDIQFRYDLISHPAFVDINIEKYSFLRNKTLLISSSEFLKNFDIIITKNAGDISFDKTSNILYFLSPFDKNIYTYLGIQYLSTRLEEKKNLTIISTYADFDSLTKKSSLELLKDKDLNIVRYSPFSFSDDDDQKQLFKKIISNSINQYCNDDFHEILIDNINKAAAGIELKKKKYKLLMSEAEKASVSYKESLLNLKEEDIHSRVESFIKSGKKKMELPLLMQQLLNEYYLKLINFSSDSITTFYDDTTKIINSNFSSKRLSFRRLFLENLNRYYHNDNEYNFLMTRGNINEFNDTTNHYISEDNDSSLTAIRGRDFIKKFKNKYDKFIQQKFDPNKLQSIFRISCVDSVIGNLVLSSDFDNNSFEERRIISNNLKKIIKLLDN